ncbi:hypothetical protein BS47DRAFT_1340629 [Hydnum rufescens UP504]|uniref:NADH:flavin oxidoreductase/NADH oxidase N-terminal domain-containing protein n=1 Tax=Hydnum rufescens UP504 TaxID=1448309 RepID=A0A9P6B5L4_9AGAM|nr:hypothetical protein BS47DRAFT_1340629 [Hydnum rufescens UP504]
MSTPNLFKPFKLGRDLQLQHRVVMAPMSRFRADDNHVPADYSVQYYGERSRVPGTLLITEATEIADESGGFPNAAGIYTEEQQNAWAKIVAAVHENNSFIFSQQFAEGRIANPGQLAKTGHVVVSAGSIPLTGLPEPHMLTIPELNKYKEYFVAAAKAAISIGFDGVELHYANGYLMNQFLEKVSNNRTDKYGGSPENHLRFPLEVIDAVSEAIGEDRLAVRISPWDDFQEMSRGAENDTYKYFIETLAERHPKLAYLHVIESRVLGGRDRDLDPEKEMNNDEFLALWSPRPYISTGGHTRESGIKVAEKHDNVLVAYARQFLANPDLPTRFKKNLALNKYDRNTFYGGGKNGYITYPFATEATESLAN